MDPFEVVVEVPKGSRNKYEVDHETGRIWLDRETVLGPAFVTPARLAASRAVP